MGDHTVKLYIYDMEPVIQEKVGIAVPVKNVWHSSIVAFGKEYSYGMDGITVSNPHKDKIYDRITLGQTLKTREALEKYIAALEKDWGASNYHLLYHNCHQFAELLIEFFQLDVSNMPSYLSRLPDKFVELIPESSIQSKIVDACADFFVHVFGSTISGGSRTKYYN